MSTLKSLLLAATLSIAPLCGCASVERATAAADVAGEESAVRARVMSLLERYSSNDPDGVIAMLDPVRFTILGSDISEVVDTPDELRALMAADFRLWGTARFTNAREFDQRTGGTLATVNLLVSFSAGGGPAVPVRLTTTWRKVDGAWMLTQSTSAVPTSRG